MRIRFDGEFAVVCKASDEFAIELPMAGFFGCHYRRNLATSRGLVDGRTDYVVLPLFVLRRALVSRNPATGFIPRFQGRSVTGLSVTERVNIPSSVQRAGVREKQATRSVTSIYSGGFMPTKPAAVDSGETCAARSFGVRAMSQEGV